MEFNSELGKEINTEQLAAINEPLLAWYRESARDLPWREDPSAYHVWVSEIMLQQTRVETVRPYYERFLKALPAVEDLAACPEDVLLKLWEGLGYYSRVRNMQRCAQTIMRDFQGRFPEDEKTLLSLPGIGPYTAGAIASIAFGRSVPAVDGNVMRVISRITGSRADIMLPQTRKRIDAALRESLPGQDAGTFNQALMDLGAMVCLPGKNAGCTQCPLYDRCAAGPGELTEQIPVRNVKTTKKKQKRTVLVIRDGARTILVRRAEKGLLAGLYEPPCLDGNVGADEALAYLRSHHLSPLRIRKLPDSGHVFTHLIWEMTGFEILVEDLSETGLPGTDSSRQMPAGEWFVVSAGRVGEAYAIPSAYRAYVPYLIHE